jgi:hypothetical protein
VRRRVGEGGGQCGEERFDRCVGVDLAFDDDVMWVDVDGGVI